MSTPADNQALGLRELAMAQQAKLDSIDGEYNTFKKAVVIALESEGTPGVTINLSGADDVDIPGVHYLDYYAPVIGDVVLTCKQGGELLIIGKIASDFADATWTQATLSSGWSHDGTGSAGSGPVMYRRVLDHGALKIQWMGAANRSSGTSALCEILPEGFRPTSRRIFVQPRDTFYGNDVKLQFETSGTVTVQGMVVTISGTTNLQDVGSWGNTALQNIGATGGTSNTHNHGGAGQNVSHTHDLDHTHAVNNADHHHAYTSTPDNPSWVVFDGIEYFI